MLQFHINLYLFEIDLFLFFGLTVKVVFWLIKISLIKFPFKRNYFNRISQKRFMSKMYPKNIKEKNIDVKQR